MLAVRGEGVATRSRGVVSSHFSQLYPFRGHQIFIDFLVGDIPTNYRYIHKYP